jgi:hypothetical protein
VDQVSFDRLFGGPLHDFAEAVIARASENHIAQEAVGYSLFEDPFSVEGIREVRNAVTLAIAYEREHNMNPRLHRTLRSLSKDEKAALKNTMSWTVWKNMAKGYAARN